VARKRVTDEDRLEVTRVALEGIASGADANDLVRKLAAFHPAHNTFPGELALELAADALNVAGVSRESPLDDEGLRERFLPECEFHGRSDHQHSHFALRAAAMIHGGVRPDLLEEVRWWRNDDFWSYAVYALVIYARAAADRVGQPASVVAREIAARRGVVLPPS
jgi:hypothetical protein